MEYKEALNHLFKLVDYERVNSNYGLRIRYDLRRMSALLGQLGDPHLLVPTIHIAGTKGKGSTAAMCSSVLANQGYNTGLYTSPHLHTFRERIALNNSMISEVEFAQLVDLILPHIQHVSSNMEYGDVTMFEALTAMAFVYFAEKADLQVIEVGLGGRLDTTNLTRPIVCGITSISLDHTSILGETVELIASEKAGIIKPGVPVVVSPQLPGVMKVIDSRCVLNGSQLTKVDSDIECSVIDQSILGHELRVFGNIDSYQFVLPLLGDFQVENALVVIGILESLMKQGYCISQKAIKHGFRHVNWPCRVEILRNDPLVVCDGAHNEESMNRLLRTLQDYFDYSSLVSVVGFSSDKDMAGMAKLLGSYCDKIYVSKSRHPRAADIEHVSGIIREYGGNVFETGSVDLGVASAIADAPDGSLILVTGSLFTAAESRESIMGIKPEITDFM